MDIRPDLCKYRNQWKIRKVDPDEVGVDSIIVVQPGEKVSVRWYCNRGII